jgi:F-type H+-transporting ATPase subunit alpha
MRLDELVRFERGQAGCAHADRDVFGCVAGRCRGVEAGDRVSCTGEVIRALVGPGLLGRIVDLLGGCWTVAVSRPKARPWSARPAIIERDFVSEPVQTGILVLDYSSSAAAARLIMATRHRQDGAGRGLHRQ